METSVPVSLKEAAEQSDALFVLLFLGEHSPSALEKVDALDQAIQATLWFPSPRLSPQQRASLDRSRRLILEILLLTGASVNQRCSSGWTASERVLSLGRVGVAASTVHDWVTNHGANWTDAVKALQLPLRDGLEAFLAENGYEVIQEQPLDEEPAPETKNDNQADMMELSSDSDDPLLPSPAKDPSLDLERAPLSPSQEPPTCDPRQQSASSSSSSSTPAPALSHSFTTPAFAAVLRLQFVPALLYDTAPKIELEVIQLLTTVIVRSHIGPINIQRDRDPMRQEYYIFVAVRTEADVTSALEGLHRARFRKKDLTLSRQRHLAAVPVVDLFWDQQRPAVSKAELANLAAASRLPEPTPGIGDLPSTVEERRRLCLIKPTSLSPTSYRIFEPLSEPPSHLFSRTLPLPVSFGFVPRPVASTALRQPQPYSSRIVQDAFDEFLRTQAGIDCEHYDGVLEFLEGVGAKAREFEERARVEVDRARKARGRR
ncbi:hypothetical protein RQP46_002579 [Phenoliferia psychrophenolica]